MKLLITIFLLIFNTEFVGSVEPDEILENPELEEIAKEIGRNLRCLVCQNEDIENSNVDEILKIEGFDEETAKELKNRAKEYLEEEAKEIANKVQELGIQDELANHKGLTLGMLLTLGEENIKTLKDFAELSSDEIIGGYDEIKGKREKFDGILEEFNLSRKDAEDLIMRARKKVFNI